jgi:hypothetical protein
MYVYQEDKHGVSIKKGGDKLFVITFPLSINVILLTHTLSLTLDPS